MSVHISAISDSQGIVLQYDLTLYHRVTVITGDSGIGKSALVSLMFDAERNGSKNTVEVTMNGEPMPYMVRPSESFVVRETTLLVFDEHDHQLVRDLLDRRKNPVYLYDRDVWILYVTRDTRNFPLVCEVSSVLQLYQENGVNKAKRLYYASTNSKRFRTILCEDSKMGLSMYKHLATHATTAGGQKGFSRYVELFSGNIKVIQHLCVVDGANIGPWFQALYSLAMSGLIDLITPLSFEWIMLYTPMFSELPKTRDKLMNVSTLANSSKYLSRERFYTEVFKDALVEAGIPYRYTKASNPLLERCLFGSCLGCPVHCKVYYTGNKLNDIALLLGLSYLVEN